MDIYDQADWTEEMDIEDLRAAIEGGATIQQAADLLCRSCAQMRGTGHQAQVSIMKGYDPDGVAQTEADYFGNCPVCGALIDMRGQLLAHIHDAEIEVIEGPAPPRLARGLGNTRVYPSTASPTIPGIDP